MPAPRPAAAGSALLTLAATLATLAVLVLAAPTALAQVEPVSGAGVEVTWTWEPAEPTVRQGTTTPMRGVAHVVVRETVCLTDTEVGVQLSLTGSNEASLAAGLGTEPQPIAFTFQIPTGAHGTGPAAVFTLDVPVDFHLLVPQTATPGTYGLTGDNQADDPSTCIRTEVTGDGGSAPAGPTAGFTVHVLEAPRAEVTHPGHETHGGATFDLSIAPGEQAAFTFTALGTYPYHDHLRPELRGTVVVGSGHPAEAEVRITRDGFSPREVGVRAGGVVTWVNDDNQRHQVSADETHPEHGAPQGGGPGDGNRPPPRDPEFQDPELGDDDPPIDFTSDDGGDADRSTPGAPAALLGLAVVALALAGRVREVRGRSRRRR